MTIRARLTLWFSIVLAVMLLGFAAASYALLARSSMQRVDDTLQQTGRAFAAAWLTGALASARGGPPPDQVMARFSAGDFELIVFDRTNRVIARRPLGVPGLMELSSRPPLLQLLAGVAGAQGSLATLPGSDAPRRVFALPTETTSGRQVVLVSQGLAERQDMLRDARVASTIAIVLLVLLALAGGYFLASRALAPVATLATQAERIGATTLRERLQTPNPRDELGQLARAFNDLLGRLDRSFGQQRAFMADASHELRTPIAVVRGEADVALGRNDRPAEEYRESLRVIREEARHMSRLVDDLLLLARSDAGAQRLALEELYLDELVAECVRSMRALAAERHMTVRYEGSGEMPIQGDESMLRRLVTNLLDNAIKHGARRDGDAAGDAGQVDVRAVREGDRYVVRVVDSGPGIAPEVRGRLFERFVRAPRSDDGAATHVGSGLGLSIARRIAEAHGGTLELARSGPDGTEFRLALPGGTSASP